MSRKPMVISVAAVSGGGKTTITKELMKRLDNSKALYFDDYEFRESPADICKWVEDGADYNEWNLEPFTTDVCSILDDPTVNYIILDYPFAYLNNGMSDYIDLSIYIETPLDIAMARRIIRDFSDDTVGNILNDLTHYLSYGRTAYLEMEMSVKPSSDIVLDGVLPIERTVNQILKQIRKREKYFT
ncbi:hypothetical protein [Lederbergia panacisoli]|uniref:hypothetical protein n=1 Tax=Lederbergia panacisoli TaxID=1255251 RepID=UPI00214BBA52|nr:hypothetical protein [Lederbergia panacisoli]MCR2822245.1 hypothetical protein [Lederbergia panacisoli]